MAAQTSRRCSWVRPALEGGADVAGALSGPDDIAEPRGGVVEGADVERGSCAAAMKA